MQQDGNFVLYKTMQPLDTNGDGRQVIWASHTDFKSLSEQAIREGKTIVLVGPFSLQLKPEGTLQVIDGNGKALKILYQAPAASPVLGAGSVLQPNKGISSVLWSKGNPSGWPTSTLSTSPAYLAPANSYTLALTPTGGLQLLGPDTTVLWQAEKDGKPIQGGQKAIMQTDGNFVIYNSNQQPLWASDTNTNSDPNKVLILQLAADGSLNIYNTSNHSVEKPLYKAPTNSPLLGSGNSMGGNQSLDLFNQLLEQGGSNGLSSVKGWHLATLTGDGVNPSITINPADPPVTQLEVYGPSLVSTWTKSATNGLATHLDPCLTGTRVSFTVNRLDQWNADSLLRFYYLPDGSTTPQLLFEKGGIPSNKWISPSAYKQDVLSVGGAE
jgi:hypothetical protein